MPISPTVIMTGLIAVTTPETCPTVSIKAFGSFYLDAIDSM